MAGSQAPALLLLTVVLVASPVASLAAAPNLVGFRAAQTGDGVNISFEVGDSGGNATLVVTHEDATGALVVDRVVPVTLAANAQATLDLTGLRADETFTVRALAADAIDVIAPTGALLPNATRAISIPVIASASAARAPLDALAPTRAFPAFRVALDRGFEPTARVVLTPEGIVVVAYLERLSAPGAEIEECVVRVASSLDGGRSFTRTVDVMERVVSPSPRENCAGKLHFALAPLGIDRVAIVHDWRSDGESARLTVLDAGSLALDASVPIEPPIDAGGSLAAASLPSGGFLLAASNARVEGGNAEGIALFRVGDDGLAEWTARFADAAWSPLRVASSPAGDVAVAWSTWQAAWFATSRDGGRSFSSPRELPIPQDARSQVELPSVEIGSATGTLHVGIVNSATGDGFYARVPRGGEVALTPLCGPREGAVLPRCERAQYPIVASGGPSVWLLFQAFEGTDGWQSPDAVSWRAIESADDGATFARPYRLKDYPGDRLSLPFDAAVFADGRPLLFGSFFFPDLPGGGNDRNQVGVVPFFDPLAGAALARATNLVLREIPAPAPRAPGATSPPARDAPIPPVAETQPGLAIADAIFREPSFVDVVVVNRAPTSAIVVVTVEGEGVEADAVAMEVPANAQSNARVSIRGTPSATSLVAIARSGDTETRFDVREVSSAVSIVPTSPAPRATPPPPPTMYPDPAPGALATFALALLAVALARRARA